MTKVSIHQLGYDQSRGQTPSMEYDQGGLILSMEYDQGGPIPSLEYGQGGPIPSLEYGQGGLIHPWSPYDQGLDKELDKKEARKKGQQQQDESRCLSKIR